MFSDVEPPLMVGGASGVMFGVQGTQGKRDGYRTSCQGQVCQTEPLGIREWDAPLMGPSVTVGYKRIGRLGLIFQAAGGLKLTTNGRFEDKFMLMPAASIGVGYCFRRGDW
jgi:hypothetical protein